MEKLTAEEKSLVIEYMDLAEKRAKYHYSEYYNYCLILTLDDFISFAYDGLCYAVKKYNQSKCGALKTFIINCIRYTIKTNVIYENSSLKLPHNSCDASIRREIRNIGITNPHIVSIDVFADIFDSTYSSNISGKLLDENSLLNVEDKLFIDNIRNLLDKDEQILFDCLFVDKISQCQIAKKLGLHINTITRRKKRLIDKLKFIL